MKILFVIDTFYTSNNGTSISAQRYAAELRKRGHEVRVLCGDQPKNEQDTYLTDGDYCTGIFHFPIFQFLCEKHDFFYGNANKKIIRRACNWADIVHVYTPFFMSNAAITYCHKTGKPVTAAFHIQPENISSSFGLGKVQWINTMIYHIFRRVTYNRVRHVHVPSLFMAKELVKNGYKAQIHVISNGIHDEFIEAGEAKIKSTERKDKTGSRKEIFNVMMIGRLSREKRQDVIINALKYSKYGDRIQLVFAGKGPEYKRYVRMSKPLKHQPLFIYKQRPELIQQLLQTDLYIHASDMESEAISCIEAFATGLVPVIANSDNSATPQFALTVHSLFTAGDPQDLARVIDFWLTHSSERARMEQKYHEAAKEYTLSHCVTLFEQMLQAEMENEEVKPSVIHTIPVLSAFKRGALRLYKRIA